ncbi:MAG: hypothetical protein HY226_05365 [Candidatus Vogelbacteria bacterium]|nr:hypothetical protein [Candidatus Vogelbacteria bacterium]
MESPPDLRVPFVLDNSTGNTDQYTNKIIFFEHDRESGAMDPDVLRTAMEKVFDGNNLPVVFLVTSSWIEGDTFMVSSRPTNLSNRQIVVLHSDWIAAVGEICGYRLNVIRIP